MILPTLDDEIRRRAESMRLFERDGRIHYGAWREWWHSDPGTAKLLLLEFQQAKQHG